MKTIEKRVSARQPIFTINSTAPIRICDNGGWTDTWFSRYGSIFNIAVSPRAEVQIVAFSKGKTQTQVMINAHNYGDYYAVQNRHHWGRHPLLEAAIEFMQLPSAFDYEISIFSAAPGGASTGTSAAVTVALIGALDRLRGGSMTLHQIARSAHRVETELLAQQSGIQDQICSTYGGINFIEISEYPDAKTEQLLIPDAIWWDLESRLDLIFLGKSHSSTQIHEMVISQLENAGPDCKQLSDLRQTAPLAREAICKGDFEAFGQTMINNTDSQRRLHPDLVNPSAERVIEIAQKHGALGWKVNGAGGNGGSLTILSTGILNIKRSMIREIEQDNPMVRSIPIRLSRDGLRVWRKEF